MLREQQQRRKGVAEGGRGGVQAAPKESPKRAKKRSAGAS